jgi:hypothetical protein
MITDACYSVEIRPGLAYANNRPERTSRWPERWMIHRPGGSFALYLVNWEVRSAGNFQPFLIRIPEAIVPEVVNAFTPPRPINEGSRFLE